jgi:hypothetical protein
MKKIDIFCIGVQKAGTTSLHDIMKQHPQLELPTVKEIFYFSDEQEYKNISNLNKFFKFYPDKIQMNVTPNFISHPKAMERIYQYNANAKIIIMLRDPVTRAVSQYKMRERTLKEKRTFKDVIHSEINHPNIAENYITSLIHRSNYVPQIKNVLKYFPRDQVYFMLFEDFVKQQKVEVDKLCQWLGISAFEFESINSNSSYYPRKTWMYKLLMKVPRKYYRKFNQIFNLELRHVIRKLVGETKASIKIEQETIQHLYEYYLPSFDEVELLSGLDCSNWRSHASR